LRWKFGSEEEDSEDGVSDIVINLAEGKICQEIVGLGIGKVGSLDICRSAREKWAG
jgi:hypothetical protein